MTDIAHPWQKPPHIEIIFESANIRPTYTAVMPVYNQEKIIRKTISGLIENAALPFDLIIVNDASSDGTKDEINRAILEDGLVREKIGKVIVINNATPIYETACDNIGFKHAKTEYIIEIQADMIIEHHGYDETMIAVLNKYSLGAVGGRLGSSFSYLDGRVKWKKYPLKALLTLIGFKKEIVGSYGERFHRAEGHVEEQVEVYICETVARGPWLVRKSDLEELNYLDEKKFFLGNDDHDYHRRLFEKKGQVVGYIPLNIHSNLEDGSTRKKRSGLNSQIYEYLRREKTGSIEYKNFLKRYKPYQNISKKIKK